MPQVLLLFKDYPMIFINIWLKNKEEGITIIQAKLDTISNISTIEYKSKEELRKAQEEMTTPVVVREEAPKQMSREEYMMKQFDQMLTLNDYKVLLNVLKEHKAKEKAEQERQQMIKNENYKYEELLSLYR